MPPLGEFVIVLWNAESAEAFASVLVRYLDKQASPEFLSLVAKCKAVQSHAERVAVDLTTILEEIEEIQ